MFEKVVVVDCKDHLLGRLASTIAKEIMNGQKVVCVRTEELVVSGSLFRNKLIFEKFMLHRGSTKPSRGPHHYRSPARMLWRTVRGMMNHFKARGQASLERLKVFEGCPHPFDKVKKVIIPHCIRQIRLKPGRKWCRLGDFSREVGWAHDGLIKKLEHKRKVKAAAWYQTKKQLTMLRARAARNVDAKLNPSKAGDEKKAAAAAPPAAARAPAKGADSKKAKGGEGKKDGAKKDGAKKDGAKKAGDGKKAAPAGGAAKKAGDGKKADKKATA
jgi:large subunit ribosomal protein L13Ae